ncbi:electron transfer complex subunit TmcD [Oleidesulfovibrio sp.]|uniref:electron transfer complex subunit TmcD n=1 Tax=Oleidesulfovibrio sp. TaxID=2909707 RepID=UPI003A88329A
MQLPDAWDWETGERTIIESTAPEEGHLWQEELQASPDGENFVAVCAVDEATFSLRCNDTVQEETYDKIWLPRFTPDGRISALVQEDGEWTMLAGEELWPDRYGYLWGTLFGSAGEIAVPVQQDGEYGMVVNGVIWETLYENATNFCMSPAGGKTAAVVQTQSMGQADISTFQQGIYSVAVNGTAWPANFVNCWTPVFSPDGHRVAAQVRRNLYDYTIAVDGTPWTSSYQCVWEPCFHPASGSVAAPVRQGGKWGVALEGQMLWKARNAQCWNLQYSKDGRNLWAIVAPEYGSFTVSLNDLPWNFRAPVVTELTVSPSGDRAVALACEKNANWQVVVDGKPWRGSYDMAWKPAFSPDSNHIAVRVERNGKMVILFDDVPVTEAFDTAFDPVFSPDGRKLLLRGVRNGKALRIVAQLY